MGRKITFINNKCADCACEDRNPTELFLIQISDTWYDLGQVNSYIASVLPSLKWGEMSLSMNEL